MSELFTIVLCMASDGDLFQKRVSWGWGKVYKAACNGTAATELAPAVIRALRNMLRGELRAPALGPMIAVVEQLLTDQHALFPRNESDFGHLLETRLDSVSRQFGDYPSSELIRRACLHSAFELNGQQTSAAEISKHCCESVLGGLVDRFGFGPMECSIMRNLHMSYSQLESFRDQCLGAAHDEAVNLLRAVADSPAGTPPRQHRGKRIEITHAALSESLPTPS